MNDRRIDRAQLDRPDPLAPEGVAGLGKDRAVDPLEFARQIAAALHERKGTVGKAILRKLVSEFVKPIVADPQIPSSDRAIAILEQLLTAVLPQLKERSSAAICARAALRIPRHDARTRPDGGVAARWTVAEWHQEQFFTLTLPVRHLRLC